MRILNTKQIRELDAYTIQHEPIASIDLMERAAHAFADWFATRVEPVKKVGVVCGTGNNGGDGLAVARILHEWGFPVKVWIIKGGAGESDDFKVNYERLPVRLERREIHHENELLSFDECDVLVDALFGSGLSRPVEGLYSSVIDLMNRSPALRIAVDIPSGLMADAHSSGAIIKADYTVCFQVPKLAFFLPECYPYTGEWVLVDIGLHKKFIKETSTPYFLTRLKDVQAILKPRSKFDHKGTFGHGLLIAGSYGKMGAAVLASRAALRAGIGLLSVHIPQAGYPILQTAVPEAMVYVDDDPRMFTRPGELTPYTALGIGPGIGQDERTREALSKTLETFGKPVVLDADALNILGANRQLLDLVPAGSILTPHPREFQRLVGTWGNDFERLEMQKQLASSLKSVIVLKGAHTSVATEKGVVYFNSTGNPGMATGGTGDILTGMLTAMLAQNYYPVEAAVAGVFLHGLAGDIAVEECGMESLTASDLINALPRAFLKAARK
ncbi:MAG TPA: NAD(P)H-hydrate dehydratase [Chryseosolibacter sp.]|nr:NAD(P)H-hydrate dehydratase [Chryseosolibacter sp.]